MRPGAGRRPLLLYLLLIAACGPEGEGEPAESDWGLALEAFRELRTVEPRFTGSFRHAECTHIGDGAAVIPRSRCAPLPAPGSRDFERMSRAGRQIGSAVRAGGDPGAARAAAIIEVVTGWEETSAVSRALSLLEDVVQRGGGADVMSDLAAGYLVRAALEQDPLSVALALEWTVKALDSAPDHPEAWFNHALALELLQLDEAALSAWGQYVRREKDRAWAKEGEAHVASLARKGDDGASTWRTRVAAALGNRDSMGLAALVVESPQGARELAIFELLPDWASMLQGGDVQGARDALAGARILGALLTQEGRDETVARAVEVIDSVLAREGGGGDVSALAEAHVALSQARTQREIHGAYDEAEHLVGTALSVLSASASPLASEAQAIQGAIEMHTGRVEEGAARFGLLAGDVDPDRFPTIVARARWGLALAALRRGEIQSASHDFARAARLYDAAGERENVGTLHHLTAEVYYVGGRHRESMMESLRALMMLNDGGPSRWQRTALLQMGATVHAAGHPTAGEIILTAALEVARKLGPTMVAVEVLIQRALMRSAMGDLDGARQDLREAAEALGSVSTGREYLEAQARAARSQVEAGGGGWGRGELEEVIAVSRADGRETLLPGLYLALGRSRLATGDTAGARGAFDQAAARIEAAGRDLSLPEFEVGFMASSERVFDAAMSLALLHGDDASAFAYLRRSRALGHAGGGGTLEARTPASDEAIMEYAVLDTVLLIAAWTAADTAFVRVPLDSVALSRMVRRWSREEDEDPGSAAALYDVLVRPVEDRIRTVRRLVLLPDRVLNRVPFGALLDSARQNRLVEAFEVSYAMEGRGGSARRHTPGPLSGLVVGAVSFDRSWFSDLPSLPGVHREVDGVAGTFTTATILFGDRATPEAVLRELPKHPVFHFAGHAVASASGSSNSRLVMASDSSGASVLDGTMIRSLDLSGLDLAVLSACSTVGNDNSRSGGVLGLAASFLDAGAGGVVASLADVDDAATATLMARFHQLHGGGLPPAAALRTAQLEHLAAWRADPGSSLPPTAWGSFVFVTH